MIIRGVLPVGTAKEREERAEKSFQLRKKNVCFKGYADGLFNLLPTAINTTKGGLALEDWAIRVSQWGIYLPQGLMAIYYRQHPFERWAINILAWTGGLGIVLFGKHEKYGFNALFNRLMIPKIDLKLPETLGGKLSFFVGNPSKLLTYCLNFLRPKENYLEIIRNAGDLKKLRINPDELKSLKPDSGKYLISRVLNRIVNKGTYWTRLDFVLKQDLENYSNKLISKAKIVSNSGKKTLAEQFLREAKSVESIIRRISVCKLSAGLTAGVLMTIIVGILVPTAVFRIVAPLDKRFVPRTKVKSGGMLSIEGKKQ